MTNFVETTNKAAASWGEMELLIDFRKLPVIKLIKNPSNLDGQISGNINSTSAVLGGDKTLCILIFVS